MGASGAWAKPASEADAKSREAMRRMGAVSYLRKAPSVRSLTTRPVSPNVSTWLSVSVSAYTRAMNRLARFASLGFAAWLLASCGGGGGGNNTPAPPAPPPPNTTVYLDSVFYSSAPAAQLASAAEITSVTHAQVTVGGTVLNYTATAGHMTAL